MKKKLSLILCAILVSVSIVSGASSSLSVKADTSVPYLWLPIVEEGVTVDRQYLVENGLYLKNDYYIMASGPVKVVSFRNGAQPQLFLVRENSTNITLYQTSSSSFWSPGIGGTISGFSNLRGHWGSFGPFLVDVPYYDTQALAASACDDGNWYGPLPPVDPDFLYDSSLGHLVDVTYKQIYNSDSGKSFLDIQYSPITSTGVDLTQEGYGVFSRYQAYGTGLRFGIERTSV